MERAIIHLNIADFAAAVETHLAPSLAGHPIIIAPTGAPRARVYDMSDQAYKEGIRKGMPLARARQINRKIKIIPPQFHRYEQIMKNILKTCLAYTPAIESGQWDGHMFLDITGTGRLFGPPADLAFRLKKQIQKSCGLTPIWSVATNKLVAKVATRLVKPTGEYVVRPGEEKTFLEPLPIALLPDISKADLVRFKTFNLVYVSQILPMSLAQLSVPFAHRAGKIHRLVRGIDTTPVTGILEKDAPLQADHEFADDTVDGAHLKKAVYLLSQTLCHALRQHRMVCGQLALTLFYADGYQKTATENKLPPTANEMVMFGNAAALLFKAWTRRIRIRHIRLVCKKPVRDQIQASLFAHISKEDKQEIVFRTMDEIRIKFGPRAVGTGLALAGPVALP
ncbi:MAG: hypothetical protein KKF12_06935 [Proteobacteria bacterium]|nr:hypothetical protein [Desulfobacula sp.]MBU3952689.1 hypothetical protein [Pseudomonadota bacterium]MBU4130537.1 hypothetical protein [Pseudomonadota bacterium]